MKNLITFCVPYFKDSDDREKNLSIFLKYWDQYVTIKIGTSPTATEFHRTKLHNTLAKTVTTPFLALVDLDCILPIEQVRSAIDLMQAGTDVVIPFDTQPYNVDINFSKLDQWVPYTIDNKLIRRFFKETPKFEMQSHLPTELPLGLMVCFRRDSFFNFGMENERFIGWGFEDHERIERAYKLNLEVKRCKGECYHLSHASTTTSRKNTSWKNNYFELLKIINMDKEEITEYKSKWEWLDE